MAAPNLGTLNLVMTVVFRITNIWIMSFVFTFDCLEDSVSSSSKLCLKQRRNVAVFFVSSEESDKSDSANSQEFRNHCHTQTHDNEFLIPSMRHLIQTRSL